MKVNSRKLSQSIVLAIFLIGPLGIACGATDPVVFHYEIEDTNRTATEVRRVRTEVGTILDGKGKYGHSETVLGSLAPEVEEASTFRIGPIGEKDTAGLWETFKKTDFLGLKTDSPKAYASSEHSERLVWQSPVSKILELCAESQSVPRADLRKIMLQFCHDTKLDQGPFDVHIVSKTEGDSVAPRAVNLKDLIAKAAEYDGKRVSVRGFYRYEYEGSNLGIDENATMHREYGRSVWLGGPSAFAKIPNIYTVEKGAWVHVEGVFTKGPGGHLGLWPGNIDRLTVFNFEKSSDKPARSPQ